MDLLEFRMNMLPLRSLLCGFGVLCCLSTHHVFAASQKPAFKESNITYHILLKLKDGKPVTQTVLDEMTQTLHLPISLKLIRPIALNAYVVDMNAAQLAGVLARTKLSKAELFTQIVTILNSQEAKKTIQYASIDHIYRLPPVPRQAFLRSVLPDTFAYHPLQWDEFLAPGGVELESAPGLKDLAWQLTEGSPNVVVAVIDTGLEINTDLQPNVLPGWRFSSPTGSTVTDTTTNCTRQGDCHGTHVAGTVAAIGRADGGSNLPIGMGPKLKVVPINVFNNNNDTTDELVAKGITWAVGGAVASTPDNNNPAKVLNISIGSPEPSILPCDSLVQDAIDYAKRTALVVFAVGNSNGNAGDYEYAKCTGILAVAATDSYGLRASYSNYGAKVDIAAPGGEDSNSPNSILSTGRMTEADDDQKNTYYYSAGTSMAAPHVAGIAGLIFSYAEGLGMSLTPDQVRALLINNVSPFGTSSSRNFDCLSYESGLSKPCGAGIVNAFASLKAVNVTDRAVFVPPSTEQLNLQDHAGVTLCQPGFVIPSLPAGTRFAVQDKDFVGYWQIQSSGCAPELIFKNPILIGEDVVTLQFGSANKFTFIAPDGMSCRVVNGTSVGCK